MYIVNKAYSVETYTVYVTTRYQIPKYIGDWYELILSAYEAQCIDTV